MKINLWPLTFYEYNIVNYLRTSMENDRLFVSKFFNCGATSCTAKLKEFFSHFDKNKDGVLDKQEFDHLLRTLFTLDPNNAVVDCSNKIFQTLDKNQDGKLDMTEFSEAWTRTWLPFILDPVYAIIVVDVQNDFISGSLALHSCPAGQDGADVVPVINYLFSTGLVERTFITLDWHPSDHISFVENVALRPLSQKSKITDGSKAKVMDSVTFKTPMGDFDQILWPTHCVQKSEGAKLHPNLKIPENSILVYKGTNSLLDSYSAFYDNNKLEKTNLDDLLRQHKVTHLFITGLATDICVNYTAMDALSLNYRVCLIEDACRGVNSKDINKFYSDVVVKGGVVANSNQFVDIVKSKIRFLNWLTLPAMSNS